MRRKPRLGSYLFLELNKTNGHVYYDQNESQANVIGFRKGETNETSNESSESFDTFGKPIKRKHRHSVNAKDLNQFSKDGHTDMARCKPNRTLKRKGITTSRFQDDDGINVDEFRDNGIVLRGQHLGRNAWKKYGTEHCSREKPGPDRNVASHGKPVSKRAENKIIKIVDKKNQKFNDDKIANHPEEGSRLFWKIEKKKGFHETLSTSCPESKRRRGYTYTQETSDNEDTHVGGQTSIEFEQITHGNHGLGTPKTSHDNGREGLPVPPVRKSSRVPKKRIFDDDDEEPIKRQRKWLQVECTGGNEVNAEHDEAMDLACDERECLEKEYQQRNEFFGPYMDERKDLPLTARQRALKLSKEGGDLQNCSNVDFPDGLQPVLPKKPNESLNEAEQAIKKEEAARRRKQQMEKNAKEIQASAIQKILGQESSRKKREEKLQKRREEIEQEKQAASMAPAVNSIRWVMGPSGNSVSFSQDIELPKIFSGPCSYPREREKCAGPSCNNVYKYRDAKTRLPLCSLQCYRAVQERPTRTVF